MDAGGRTNQEDRVEEVELRRDAYMDIGGRATHDPRDGGGRIASGTAIEEAKAEQRPRTTSSYKEI